MAEYYAQPVEYPHPPLQPDGSSEPRPEGVPLHAHEGTDVNIRPLVYVGVGLVIFLVATCIFLVFLFDLFSFVEQKDTKKNTGVDGVKYELPAGVPPLQGVQGTHDNTGAKDMLEFKAQNKTLLETYSTAKDGKARIPVDKAIDLALEKKLFKAATGPSTAPVAPAGGAAAGGNTPTGEAPKPKVE